jgi:hypothetical protein
MDLWGDSNGPPRKRMRKGTKSCVECKISSVVADMLSAKVSRQAAGAKSVAHITQIAQIPAMNVDYEALHVLIRSIPPRILGQREVLTKETSDIVFGSA